ncbi:DUF6519 domain-containing protein [Catenulispora rubra]|uniref:DUF6519 domain-containing protein n=1 Tax=Catenulispora rubra TaxID=280293 RepID=UPI0018920DC6|nr:DUF6519 domain-containing protein [Catenulispora rubra]
MHGDFSRLTFDAAKHYSAVYAQQGRVQLDSDANEQLQIDLDTARRLAAALIGQNAGPRDHFGFQIGFEIDDSDHLPDLTIGPGEYYVDGIRNDADRPAPGTAVVDTTVRTGSSPATWSYYDQPDAFRDPENPDDRLPDFPFVVYLKMYERLVAAVEDPSMREVALGAAMPDTAARTKVSWQVLAASAAEVGVDGTDAKSVRAAFATWAKNQATAGDALAARAKVPARVENDPCLSSPDAAFRGRENQLYRVEIHDGGQLPETNTASSVAMRSALSAPTFVWSRENGSVVFGITALADQWVTLDSLGRDDKLALDVGDWVEVVDDSYVAHGRPLPLLQIDEIDIPGHRVMLSGTPAGNVGADPTRHPYLRRWDQTAPTGRGAPRLVHGAIEIKEGVWLDLENGVQVYFQPGGSYRTGDYWTVPARIATGDVVWPADATGNPLLEAPNGPAWHYAPLAYLSGREQSQTTDLRMVFAPMAVGPETLPAQETSKAGS